MYNTHHLTARADASARGKLNIFFYGFNFLKIFKVNDEYKTNQYHMKQK